MKRLPRLLWLASLGLCLAGTKDARDRFSWRLRERVDLAAEEVAAAATGPLFSMATASGAGMGTECSGSTITGRDSDGASVAVTFARTSAAWCRKADFTWVQVSSGQPRATVGETGQTQLGVMVERAATNDVLRNRDLSNAGVWATSSVTCTKTATGIDGVANSASLCTGSAGAAAVWQTVTASGSRSTSFFIKRVSGTGTIRVTREGGGGWIDITADLSSDWKRFQPQSCGAETKCVQKTGLKSTFTNPVIGWEFTTPGDSIAIDFVQDESTAWATSPIDTAGTAVARNAETFALNNPSGTFTNFSFGADVRPEFLSESYIVMLEDGSSRSDFSTANGNGSIRFELYWGGTSTASSGVCWTGNTPGVWHRVAAQWNNVVPKACCDGSCTNGTKHGSASVPSTFTLFRIGHGAFGGSGTQGVLKNICLDNTATGCI